jgi:hypothetical protein
MQEGVVDPHQRQTRGSTETVLPQIPPPRLDADMGPGPVELDSEQRMGRMLTVQLLVDHEVEVSPEGVAPVTPLEPRMRRTNGPASSRRPRMVKSARLDPTGVDTFGFSAAARTQSRTLVFCDTE